MKMNMNQSKSDSVHYNLLDGAPAGAETALARFVVCKGYRPQSYQQVEEHIQTCEICQIELNDRKAAIQAETYRNTAGWWTPFWRGLAQR